MTFRTEIIGNQTLILGDCREVMPTLGRFDAFVTDPPYGLGESSGSISIKRNKNNYDIYDDSEDNVLLIIVPVLQHLIRITDCGIATVGGKNLWHYPRPNDVGMFYQPAACGMTHWGRATCQPILFYGLDPHRGKTIKPIHYQLTEKPDTNGHPCPKPIEATKWLVSRASALGGKIIDPFMGSGTTLVACQQLGRKGTGIEISEKYFDIACKRVEHAAAQPRLFTEPVQKPVQEKML